jgi:hypothetical protein
MHRLVPNTVILRLAPGQGSELRAAALEAAARGPELLLTAPLPAPLEDAEGACAALGACAASGAFGPRELALLQQYLDAAAAAATAAAANGGAPPRAAPPPVKELVARARLEGLSAEERAARAAEEGAGEARRVALRAALQRSQEEAEYSRLVGRRGAAAPADQGLRALAPQAALGGGLLLALGSATLLGYLLGRNMFGEGSAGAWVLALAFGAATLVLEATLLLLRLGRQEGLEADRAKQRAREAALVRSRAGAAAGAQGAGGGSGAPAAGAEGGAAGSGSGGGSSSSGGGAPSGLRRRPGAAHG